MVAETSLAVCGTSPNVISWASKTAGRVSLTRNTHCWFWSTSYDVLLRGQKDAWLLEHYALDLQLCPSLLEGNAQTPIVKTSINIIVVVFVMGQSEPAPICASVGCFINTMGCIFSSSSWPYVNLTSYHSQPFWAADFWPFLFCECFFPNSGHTTLQRNHLVP